MLFDGVLLEGFSNRTNRERAENDQTACKCRLILLYTLRKKKKKKKKKKKNIHGQARQGKG